MTGCNSDQQVKWRKEVKHALQKAGFATLDPTADTARKGVLAVAVDIEEADIVIANMWKESIGTVVGIVKAQKLGIPVVLIDRNCLNSPVLKELVDYVVRDEIAAVNYVANELSKTFQQTIIVQKKQRSGGTKEEEFSPSKLQKSLEISCSRVGIDDPVFSTKLFHCVKRNVLKSATAQKIQSEMIRSIIFQELMSLTTSEVSGLHQSDQERIKQNAAKMKLLWEDYEFNKELRDEESAQEKMYLDEINSLSYENAELRLKLQLLCSRNGNVPIADESLGVNLATCLQSLLENQRALCIRHTSMGSFQSAFERLGLSTGDFERFFVEETKDGAQSNLNKYLKDSLAKYSFVLYAWNGLRHCSDPALVSSPNLIRGSGASHVISRFLAN
ncbi:MAG: hypothetical protein FWD64_02055 [Acidobacteriaceae bacterium]|nr:hypothetical protein [Acidobacteriaceae bacterium]